MRYTFLISILILILISCKKDKFSTAPSLTYKSVNTKTLHQGETIRFGLSFTDAEGDLTDSLFILKFEPKCVDSRFTAVYKLPDFPSGKNQAGDITVTFDYNDIPPKCPGKNDTAVFKFVLKDKAQHLSDTAVSDAIAIIQ